MLNLYHVSPFFCSLDDSLFYGFVRNNVHGRSLIFGSAIALETDVLEGTGRLKFCPYAHETSSGGTNVFDIALSYDYTTDETEWYAEVRSKNLSGVELVNDSISSRK